MIERVRVSNKSGEVVPATEGARLFIEFGDAGRKRMKADLTEDEVTELIETFGAVEVRDRRVAEKVA